MKATYEKLGIPEAERKYLAGVTAQYECLRGSTPRCGRHEGMRPIKELGAGRRGVLAGRGDQADRRRPGGRRRHASGDKEIFEIRAGTRVDRRIRQPSVPRPAGRTPARSAAGPVRPSWVAVEDLRVGDYVAVPTDVPEFGRTAALGARHVHAGARLHERRTCCWFLGLYLGDGYIHDRVGLPVASRSPSIATDERPRRRDRAASVAEQFGLDVRARGRSPTPHCPRHGALVDFLELNGLGGDRHTKRLPDWVSGLPTDQRLAFLAGFIDADGTVRAHASAKNPVITSANEHLLDDDLRSWRCCAASA